ncbi:MAG: hypothetical protein EOO33_05140 [Comamonadaceae bacterium]|nr:MAG: hypothetical protein EOO33_05140 [Comamonadaceae bacterium]
MNALVGVAAVIAAVAVTAVTAVTTVTTVTAGVAAAVGRRVIFVAGMRSVVWRRRAQRFMGGAPVGAALLGAFAEGGQRRVVQRGSGRIGICCRRSDGRTDVQRGGGTQREGAGDSPALGRAVKRKWVGIDGAMRQCSHGVLLA